MLKLKLTKEQEKTIQHSLVRYRGNAVALESALGALFIGANYGWRVLKIIHSPATYKKYEDILGVSFQDLCPERTLLSKKSWGLAIADRLNSFWAIATGKKKIKDKAFLDNDFADEAITQALKEIGA